VSLIYQIFLIEVQVSNLNVDLFPSDMNGAPLACPNDDSASIEAIVTGAVGSVDYSWNQGGQGPILENIGAGLYSVIVTDEAGCTDTETVELQSQDSINIDFTGYHCTSLKSYLSCIIYHNWWIP